MSPAGPAPRDLGQTRSGTLKDSKIRRAIVRTGYDLAPFFSYFEKSGVYLGY